jgi:hypothetical protein
MTLPSFIELAQSATYPTGRIQGGWEYVMAAFILTWAGLVLYPLSLWLRRRAQTESPDFKDVP